MWQLSKCFLFCFSWTVGYVKTTAVEIDFNSLKNKSAQQEYDPDVYDDIDVVSSDNRCQKSYFTFELLLSLLLSLCLYLNSFFVAVGLKDQQVNTSHFAIKSYFFFWIFSFNALSKSHDNNSFVYSCPSPTSRRRWGNIWWCGRSKSGSQVGTGWQHMFERFNLIKETLQRKGTPKNNDRNKTTKKTSIFSCVAFQFHRVQVLSCEAPKLPADVRPKQTFYQL